MSLAQALIKFITLYKTFDKHQDIVEAETVSEESASRLSFEKITIFARSVKDTLIGNIPTNKKLEIICDQCIGRIKNLDEDDAANDLRNINKCEVWIKLIWFLKDKAKEAQSLKKFSGQSRCCKVIHGVISLIISNLSSENSQYREAFDNLIKQLRTETQELSEQIIADMEKNRGMDIEKLSQELNNTLLKLAYLGDTMSISEVKSRNLLDYLSNVEDEEKDLSKKSSCHDTYNAALPYCMQNSFAKTLYIDRYQHYTKVSYEEFIDNPYIFQKTKPPEPEKNHHP